ncbi:MerR family transcriptional regulator [Thalassolituus sp. LLYu03]|uniref:MerR family transcriptional regulator n=1 Tax=Thalassolituus sp. LLYu03 TaxID=3421656 RepID=UPI003D281000
MRVQDLARSEGINAGTIRHYVRIGLLQAPKDDNGYHNFGRTEQQRLRFIRQARDLGFTLDDIQTILQEAEKGKSPCPVVRHLIEPRLVEARKRLLEMQAMVERMESAMQSWQSLPDCQPCGDHLCHLIEGSDHETLAGQDQTACRSGDNCCVQ